MTASQRLLYLDASALVKLVIDEPERQDLGRFLSPGDVLATSGLALVEVPRAVGMADSRPEVMTRADELLQSCAVISVGDAVLDEARRIASRALRTLDAIHIASALHIGATQLVTYDRRMIEAARDLGLDVAHPGRPA